MATPKKTAEAKASKLLIPSLSEFVIPADELEENSYASLEIPSLKISRETQDQASLRMGDGTTQLLKKGGLEVIFFHQSKIVSCSAKRISDDENVCYSTNTDGYSMKGLLCRSECSYKDKDVYKRGYSKKIYLLIREAGSDDPFQLASYKASYATIKDVSGSLNTLRRNLHAHGITTLAFAVFDFHVAAVPAAWKKSIKLPIMDFKAIEFVRALTPEEVDAVKALHVDFLAFEKAAVKSKLEYAEKRALSMAIEKAKVEGAQTTPSPAVPSDPEVAAEPAPMPPDTTPAPADAMPEEDDDLPF